MTIHTLGQVSLTISALLYFIWFMPQLRLTFQRRDVNGLSFTMHCILLLGYFADLLYGFGQQLPWLYRAVTITGLAALAIEHYQFARFGFQHSGQRQQFKLISMVLLTLLIIIIVSLSARSLSASAYNIAGYTSMCCWLTFSIPQIVKNHKLQSTLGLSEVFLLIMVLTSVLDIIAAYTLHWPLPSRVSSPIGLLLKLVLLLQYYYYSRQPRAIVI